MFEFIILTIFPIATMLTARRAHGGKNCMCDRIKGSRNICESSAVLSDIANVLKEINVDLGDLWF